MRPHEIEVGAVYRLGRGFTVPKRVIFLDLADTHIRGGKVKFKNITSGAQEIWSAEIFANLVVEKISDAPLVSPANQPSKSSD